ncbi:MAG: vitamin K epoxide reductase family protein [Bacteroidota bacterium]
MQISRDDNTVYVLWKALRHERIRVTHAGVNNYLLAHPHYPSLKSICDALKSWNVNYAALKLAPDEIMGIEPPFIAHMNHGAGQLVFVESIKKGMVYGSSSENQKYSAPFGQFSEKHSGAVILIENEGKSGEKNYPKNRQTEILDALPLVLLISAFALLAIYLYSSSHIPFHQGFNLVHGGLFASVLIGFIASVFLVLHELKISTPIADKICSFSSRTDCDAVLNSGASGLFGWVSWADAGIIWFSSLFLYLIGSSGNSLATVVWVSLLALPYPIFSIWYQAVKLKKWCPFCLAVQGALIAIFMLSAPLLLFSQFVVNDIMKLILTFSLVAATWFLYRAWLREKSELLKMRYNHYAFRRKPDLFRYLLTKNRKQQFTIDGQSLILGADGATVTITAFLSLYCKPCVSAFMGLRNLPVDFPETRLHLVFSVYKDEESKKLINAVYRIYVEKGHSETLRFIEGWYGAPISQRKEILNSIDLHGFDIARQVGETNDQLFRQYHIAGTPTVFVNGYLFPREYEFSDIEIYLDEIKQLK